MPSSDGRLGTRPRVDPRPAIADALAAVQAALEIVEPRAGVWLFPGADESLLLAQVALVDARREVDLALAARARLEAA